MNCLELDRESKGSAEAHQSCVQFIYVSNVFDDLSLFRFYVMYLASLFSVFVVVNFYYLMC